MMLRSYIVTLSAIVGKCDSKCVAVNILLSDHVFCHFCLVIISLSYHQHQTLEAAWPHAMGIRTAHVFQMIRDIWPSLNTPANKQPPSRLLLNRLFQTPSILTTRFGLSPQPKSKVEFDFRSSHGRAGSGGVSGGGGGTTSAKHIKKKGTGKILGSSF